MLKKQMEEKVDLREIKSFYRENSKNFRKLKKVKNKNYKRKMKSKSKKELRDYKNNWD